MNTEKSPEAKIRDSLINLTKEEIIAKYIQSLDVIQQILMRALTEVITIPDGPVKGDGLAYSVKDLYPDNTKKGLGGTTFNMKFDHHAFDEGELITYDKFEGTEVYIKSVDAVDETLYVVQLVPTDDPDLFLDNKFLDRVNYFRVSSPRASYQSNSN